MNLVIDKFNFGSKYKKIFFKPMEEANSNYEISNEGHIRSNHGRRKILKHIKARGRFVVNLHSNGVKKRHYVDDLLRKYWNAT